MKDPRQLLIEANYQFAKTMPQNPHYYTLRTKWENDSDWVRCAQFIRDHGYKEMFKRKEYTCFNINGWKYWTCGDPLNKPDGTPYTIVLNRAVINYHTKYDEIAPVYDDLFIEQCYKDEEKELLSSFYLSGSVLDIGCGTGTFIDNYPEWEDYIGLDISKNMLFQFMEKHPESKTVMTTVNDFYTEKKFDTIIGLFGVASYMTLAEIHKAISLLSPGGKIYLSAYCPDYYPVTYLKTGIHENHIIHDIDFMKVVEDGNYLIYTNDANFNR